MGILRPEALSQSPSRDEGRTMKLRYIGSTVAILGLLAGTSALAALTVPMGA
jgi:hypothetical protein